jgi:hypothetical protein
MDRLTYSKWQAALHWQAEDGSPLGQKIDDINLNVTTRCVGALAAADFKTQAR